MQLQDVMAELEAAGSAQTRKTYARHGMPSPCFGVSFAKLGEMKKRIKQNQALAEGLWNTGVVDARFLAVMVADPALPAATLESWVRDLRDHTLAGTLAGLVARNPEAVRWLETWIDDPAEPVARAGWALAAHLAMEDKVLPDAYFEPLVIRIEANIHGAKNREKEGMHTALLAIGARSDALEAIAIEAGRRIGPVDIDHGDTACKTPDTVPYIQKARAHQRAKAEKAAAKAAAKARP